jgi:hypothetical protein
MKTFLLNFAEPTVWNRPVGDRSSSVSSGRLVDSKKSDLTIIAGTQTLTEVRHEEVDEDPDDDWRDLLAFPR